jgi:hypothetical protein
MSLSTSHPAASRPRASTGARRVTRAASKAVPTSAPMTWCS